MIRDVLRYRFISISHLAGLLFVMGGWVWAYEVLEGVHQTLILHFNNYVGINQVGTPANLVPMGIMGIAITGINFFISLSLMRKERFLGRLVAFVTLFLDLLIFIAFAAIIGVNY